MILRAKWTPVLHKHKFATFISAFVMRKDHFQKKRRVNKWQPDSYSFLQLFMGYLLFTWNRWKAILCSYVSGMTSFHPQSQQLPLYVHKAICFLTDVIVSNKLVAWHLWWQQSTGCCGNVLQTTHSAGLFILPWKDNSVKYAD